MPSILRHGLEVFGAFSGAAISIHQTLWLEYVCRITEQSGCLATFTPWRYILTAVLTGFACWAVVHYGLSLSFHAARHVRKHLDRKAPSSKHQAPNNK